MGKGHHLMKKGSVRLHENLLFLFPNFLKVFMMCHRDEDRNYPIPSSWNIASLEVSTIDIKLLAIKLEVSCLKQMTILFRSNQPSTSKVSMYGLVVLLVFTSA